MTFASRFLGQALKLPPVASRDIDVQRDLRVRMPDGVVLLADRYAPRTRPWPLRPPPPLVLVRSPYGRRRSWGLMFGRMSAERGFQAVIQSCRGTFGSGGTFDPFGPDEHDDGLATVAWLREQPGYPGSFGTCGPSYLGMTQWAIAADAGDDLAALAAQVTTADFRDALLRLAPGRPERQPDGTIHTRIALWPAPHRFRRGHRLRLQVSSGAHPRYARNPGAGEPLGAAVRLASARQQVFHDPGHPSALILPVPP